VGVSLAAIPSHDKTFERALATFRAGDVKDAERLFKSILRKQPRHIGALNLIGIILTQHQDFAEAEKYLRRALEVGAPSEVTLYNYGTVLKALKRPAEALEQFSQALTVNTSVAETWNNRGTVFNDLQRYDDAIKDFDQALRLNPRYAEALCNKAKSLVNLKRFNEALSVFDAALALKPDFKEAWCGRSDAYLGLKRYDEAETACEKAIALRPDFANAWLGLGNVLATRGKYPDALQAYRSAVALGPGLAEAWLMCGNACVKVNRHYEAVKAYQEALALNPDITEASYALGSTLLTLNQRAEALTTFDALLAVKPDLAEAWVGRGNVFWQLKQYNAALSDFDRAIGLKHDLAEAWYNRGIIFQELKQYPAAIAAYDAALKINPNLTYAEGFRLFAKRMLCDWANTEVETKVFIEKIRSQEVTAYPFVLLSMSSSATEQLQCAKRYADTFPVFPSDNYRKVYSHSRIRVAYLSADFDNHAVAHLIVGLLEHHNRSRFEIIGLSLGPYQTSQVGQRIQRACERFVDVRDKSDQEIAQLMRDLEIDIAIDLMGHTQSARPYIFAQRPAPVQVSYLGYIGTTGADFIDYIIADKLTLPFEQQDHFIEKIVHLPDCFLVNDNQLQIAQHTLSRQEAGLPSEGFVFCSFNSSYKLGRPIFQLWMHLLSMVKGSVLWLVASNSEMMANLELEAQHCGIDPKRIVFAPRVSLPEHLARQRLADLFLDTTPYNAGATGAAALWAGLPVLTIIGETFVSRMGASMLHAVGLPELVTNSLAEYEALALKIATKSEFCLELKRKLARNRERCALFDTTAFAKHIEAAYETMQQAHEKNLQPIGFTVTPTMSVLGEVDRI
jgi:protein O-GlcNAc transferase